MSDNIFIDLSLTDEIIELDFPIDEVPEVSNIENVTIIKSGLNSTYAISLSQVDIDNKFITVNELNIVEDKSNVLVFLENSGFKFEYGIDYTINNYNQITWNGFGLDGKLIVGDIIKVYY